MFENMSEIPVTIMALIIIVKIFLDYLTKMRQNKDGNNPRSGVFSEHEKQTFYEMSKKINDLYEWHSKEDADGRKVWYTPSSHEVHLKGLKTIIHHVIVL